MNRTLALIKPDAFERLMVGQVVSMIEDNGFRFTQGFVYEKWPLVLAEEFYGRQHRGKHYFPELVRHMTSGPIMALILEAPDAMRKWRDLMGAADPKWRKPDTIRAILQEENAPLYRNLVHGSDSEESYIHEMGVLVTRGA